MPRTCDGCRFWTADDAPAACPGCGRGLAFTLLPPPERTDPAAVPDEPPPVPAYKRPPPRPTSLWYDLVTSTPFLAVAAVGLFVVLLGLLWAGIEQGQAEAMKPRPK